jgi:hypothetical protein
VVTWLQLACIAGAFVGLGLTLFGLMAVYAAEMSDDPADNESAPVIVPLVGIVVLFASIAALWL